MGDSEAKILGNAIMLAGRLAELIDKLPDGWRPASAGDAVSALETLREELTQIGASKAAEVTAGRTPGRL